MPRPRRRTQYRDVRTGRYSTKRRNPLPTRVASAPSGITSVVSRRVSGPFRNPHTGQFVTRTRRASIQVDDNAADYVARLQTFLDLSRVNAYDLLGAHVLEHTRRVQMRTPVLTGRARNSYHAILPGSSDTYAYRDNRSRTFNGSLGIRTAANEAAAGSNVEYFLMLEAGNSKQAPEGMVAVTLKEMSGELDRAIDDALRRQWASL